MKFKQLVAHQDHSQNLYLHVLAIFLCGGHTPLAQSSHRDRLGAMGAFWGRAPQITACAPPNENCSTPSWIVPQRN